jgi:hypothetical protein
VSLGGSPDSVALALIARVRGCSVELLAALRQKELDRVEGLLGVRQGALDALASHLRATGTRLELEPLTAAWADVRSLDLEVQGAFVATMVALRKSLRGLRGKRQVLGVYGMGMTAPAPVVVRQINDVWS